MENVKEAVRGIIESYLDAEVEIPWIESNDTPEGTIRTKWIVVNV